MGPFFDVSDIDGVNATCPKLFVLVQVDGERVAANVTACRISKRLPVLVHTKRVLLDDIGNETVAGVDNISKRDVRKFCRRDGEIDILEFFRVVLERDAHVVRSRRERLRAGNRRGVDGKHREVVRNCDAVVVDGVLLGEGDSRQREALSK